MTYIGDVLPTDQGGTGVAGYFDGQLLIGDTATNSLLVNTITAGPGITVTNGSGTITLSASPAVLNTATLTTNNAVTQTIATVVVAEASVVIVQGSIIGAQSDFSNAVGGTFYIVASRETAMNVFQVGTTVTSVQSTTAATFSATIDVGLQAILVQVTGINPITYNWTCTYTITVS